MANWSTVPTRTPNSQPFRVHRVKPGPGTKGICVGHDIIGTELHYWKGRSVPCGGNQCQACQSGQIPRWKGYIQLLNSTSNTVIICEVTDRCIHDILAAKATHGTLRGLGVIIRRQNAKVNGPLEIEFSGIQRSSGELPDPAPLTEMLERMWEQRQPALPGMESEADPAGPLRLRAI